MYFQDFGLAYENASFSSATFQARFWISRKPFSFHLKNFKKELEDETGGRL